VNPLDSGDRVRRVTAPQEDVMRLRLRESGSSTVTLEQAAFRDGHSSIPEGIGPWLRRTGERLVEWVKAALATIGPWVTRSMEYVAQTTASMRQRSMPWLRQTGTRLGAGLTSASHAVIPWLKHTQSQVRESTRTFVATAAPRLKAARERVEARTVSTVDSLRPWFMRARQQGHRRIEVFREAAEVKRRAGVPIWATVLLVVVAVLIAQALAHQSVEKRHELQTRQLMQIHKSEQTASQARAAEALLRESEDAHRVLGTTVAWTIASALSRKKNNELDLYFHELAKNGHIDLVVFADTNGKVVLASDPGLRGADFEKHFPAALLQEPTVAIHRGSTMNRLVAPVHRFGTRLGTAVLVYKAR
jgi:hypothetical protein